MTTHDDDRIQHLLKQALPPTTTQPGATLQRDLWTAMRRRLDERSAAVPWFDWALLAGILVWFVFFPRAILILLYHL